MVFAAWEAIDFSVSTGATIAAPTPDPSPKPFLPDWLGDVRKAEQPSGLLSPPAKTRVTDWLQDLRHLEEPQGYKASPEKVPGQATGSQPKSSGPSRPIEWLEDVRQSEQMPGPAANVGLPESEAAIPGPKVSSEPASPATPPVSAAPFTIQLPAAVVERIPADPQTTGAGLVEKPGLANGPGQSLDLGKAENLQPVEQAPKREEAATQGTEPIEAVFHKARTEIAAWVDREENLQLIMDGNMDTERQHPEALKLIDKYRTYGEEMVQKLWQHLEFMVENRRKFYASRT
jgi:hypothetical protein